MEFHILPARSDAVDQAVVSVHVVASLDGYPMTCCHMSLQCKSRRLMVSISLRNLELVFTETEVAQREGMALRSLQQHFGTCLPRQAKYDIVP